MMIRIGLFILLLLLGTCQSDVSEKNSMGAYKCIENLSVSQRVQESLIVLKGKVIEVILDPVYQKYIRGNGLPSKTLVEVMEIFKGENIVEPILKDSIFRKGESGNIPLLLIDGINNPELCKSDVQPLKTFLFFLNLGFSRNQLRIQFSILDGNPENVALVSANLNGYSGIDKSNSHPPTANSKRIVQNSAGIDLIDSHLCGGKLTCHIYAFCEEDPSLRKPKCVCPRAADCPSDTNSLYEHLEKPVCGSDGKTYKSLCLLRAISCERGTVIAKLHDGQCNTFQNRSPSSEINKIPPRSHCGRFFCPPYAKCHSPAQNKEPVCDCHYLLCSPNLKLVCGSDKSTYSNLCQLKFQACNLNKEIWMLHEGACKSGSAPSIRRSSCGNILCPHYGECEYNVLSGKSACTCEPKQCSSDFAPVCGSNQMTYINECHMKKQACLHDELITLQYRGECGRVIQQEMYQTETEKDIPRLQCPPYGEMRIDSYGKLGCSCPSCPNTKSPVCGSDGFSYTNVCELKRYSCMTNRTILLEKNSACDPCTNLQCSFGGKCSHTDDNRTLSLSSEKRWLKMAECSCRHFSCGTNYHSETDVLCADDGNSYSNLCLLKQYECIHQQSLNILHYGRCKAENPCSRMKCNHPNEYCRINFEGKASCVCPQYCPDALAPVCGTDNITYESICHLNRMACMKKEKVKVLHSGKCSEKKLCNGTCQRNQVCRRQRDPSLGVINPQCICADCPQDGVGGQVCGSDDNTYRSLCHLRQRGCLAQNYQLTVQHDGPCDACKKYKCKNYAKCETGRFGEAVCVCPTDCSHNNNPVCGSDGVTHQNECFLKVKSCASNKLLTVERSGPCRACKETCSYGRICRDGKCVCIDECPLISDPTCGTDGRMYRNPCELHKTACEKNIDISSDLYGTMCDKTSFMSDDEKTDKKSSLSLCDCNSYGTVPETLCNRNTKQCVCKKNVRGIKCDVCSQGFWNLKQGCQACRCNLYGSKSFNCHPETGQCYCKGGVYGQLCDKCSDGRTLGEKGCIDNCNNHKCKNYAKCETGRFGEVICVCPTDCTHDSNPVCGSDGITYQNECFLKVKSCASNILLTVEKRGPCMRKQGTYQGVSPGAYRFRPTSSAQLRIPESKPNIREFEVRFKLSVANGNGIIFYYGSFTKKPFLSAVLNNGFLEYRFNTGHKTTILKSERQLEFNKEYDITILKRGKRGVLKISGMKLVKKKSGGRQKLSTIQSKLFLGKLPLDADSLRFDQLGNQKSSFTGCLTSFSARVNQMNQPHIYQLNTRETLLDRITQIDENGCASQQLMLNTEADSKNNFCDPHKSKECKNGGKCEINFNKEGICRCNLGYQGAFCEEKSHSVPQFNGNNSYLRLSTHDLRLKKKLELEIDLFVENENGLLGLIMKKHAGNSASFLSISIMEGHIQVDCRTGGGLYILKSLKKIPIKQWFTLKVTKKRRKISLNINDDSQTIRIVPAGFKKMSREYKRKKTKFNVNRAYLYIGGYPYSIHNTEIAGLKTWFKGAIQKIDLNRKNRDLSRAEGTSTVHQWQGAPCFQLSNKCSRHGLVCEPRLNETNCSCPKFGSPNFYVNCVASQRMLSDQSHRDLTVSGNLATETSMNFALKLDGKLFNKFMNNILEKKLISYEENILLEFKTNARDGIQLLMKQSNSISKDFLILAVRDGYQEIAVNLEHGPNIVRLTSSNKVNDERWHTVEIIRNQNKVTLTTDNDVVSSYISGREIALNTDGYLWLGGFDGDFTGFPRSYLQKFIGCIKQLRLNNKNVILNRDNVFSWSSFPKCDI